MKHSQKYILLIVIFIVLIFSITITYLYIHYKEQGTGTFVKKYSDIVFNNAQIDYEDNVLVKLDSEHDCIHIELSNLNNKKEIEISLDAINLGNVDLVSDNYTITNVDSNINSNLVKITSSLEKNDMINGGDSKKIIIRIKYNGNAKIDNPYYNFNINYSFKEQSL